MTTLSSKLLLSKLLSGATIDGGVLTATVPDDWMQGRSVFGGLQIALAVRAMRSLVPDAILRTVQATFIAPVGHEIRVEALVLRTGKSVTHVEARILDGDATAAVVIGVFGASRASVVHVTPVQPSVECTERIMFPFIPGIVPNFVQHFDVALLRGGLPYFGSKSVENVFEVAILDVGAATESHIIAIADFVPPVGLSHVTGPAPGSTVTWMLELLVDRLDGLPLRGFRVDAQLVAAHDGYTSQSTMIWGPGGEPIAISRQSMLVFG